MHVFCKVALLFGFATGLAADGIAAQEQAPNNQSPQERQLLQVARQTATIAGGARYCKLDPDDIEEFIGKAYARLALLSRDDYQKVLGRLEFKNILAATSAREPKDGCDAHEERFNTVLRDSR